VEMLPSLPQPPWELTRLFQRVTCLLCSAIAACPAVHSALLIHVDCDSAQLCNHASEQLQLGGALELGANDGGGKGHHVCERGARRRGRVCWCEPWQA
jgi:hypothetical protein